MKIKSQRDFWSGLMFIVVGAAFALGAASYSLGQSARPGPGYFPLGLGVLLAILGAFVLFKALTIESEGGDPIGSFAWRPLLIVVASVAGFGVALPRLGMFITLPMLVFISAIASDEFSVEGAALNAAVLTVASWGIFKWGLGLTIPLLPSFLG